MHTSLVSPRSILAACVIAATLPGSIVSATTFQPGVGGFVPTNTSYRQTFTRDIDTRTPSGDIDDWFKDQAKRLIAQDIERVEARLAVTLQFDGMTLNGFDPNDGTYSIAVTELLGQVDIELRDKETDAVYGVNFGAPVRDRLQVFFPAADPRVEVQDDLLKVKFGIGSREALMVALSRFDELDSNSDCDVGSSRTSCISAMFWTLTPGSVNLNFGMEFQGVPFRGYTLLESGPFEVSASNALTLARADVVSPAPVPLPATLPMLVAGLGALIQIRRARRQRPGTVSSEA